MLLRYFRLDEIMGNLVTAMGGLLKDLGRFLMIIVLIIIPYGLIQENFIYPNQYLRSLEEKYTFKYKDGNDEDGITDVKLRNGVKSIHFRIILKVSITASWIITLESVNKLKSGIEEEYQFSWMGVQRIGEVLIDHGLTNQFFAANFSKPPTKSKKDSFICLESCWWLKLILFVQSQQTNQNVFYQWEGLKDRNYAPNMNVFK